MHGKVDNSCKVGKVLVHFEKAVRPGGQDKQNSVSCVHFFPLFLALNIVPKITPAVTLWGTPQHPIINCLKTSLHSDCHSTQVCIISANSSLKFIEFVQWKILSSSVFPFTFHTIMIAVSFMSTFLLYVESKWTHYKGKKDEGLQITIDDVSLTSSP